MTCVWWLGALMFSHMCVVRDMSTHTMATAGDGDMDSHKHFLLCIEGVIPRQIFHSYTLNDTFFKQPGIIQMILTSFTKHSLYNSNRSCLHIFCSYAYTSKTDWNIRTNRCSEYLGREEIKNHGLDCIGDGCLSFKINDFNYLQNCNAGAGVV